MTDIDVLIRSDYVILRVGELVHTPKVNDKSELAKKILDLIALSESEYLKGMVDDSRKDKDLC